MSSMKHLQDALMIFKSYGDKYDYWCTEHDEAWFSGPEPDEMNPEDVKRLDELGFLWDDEMWWCPT